MLDAQQAQALEDDTIWGGDIGNVYCYAKGPAPKPVIPPSDYMLNPNWNKPGTIPGNGEPQTQPGNGYNNPNPPESNKESDPCKGIPVCARCGGIERTTHGSQSMAKSVPSHGPTCTKAECKCKKDCAGVPNGTAYIDACEQCVKGTTGKQPCSRCLDKNGSLSPSQQDVLDKTIKELASTCIGNLLADMLKNDCEKYKVNWFVGNPLPNKLSGFYNPSLNMINITDMSSPNLLHEMLHKMQDNVYRTANGGSLMQQMQQNPTMPGKSNMEFEVFMILDIMSGGGSTMGNSEKASAYSNFIWKIRDGGLPNDFDSQFFLFLEEFKQMNPGYNTSTDPRLSPAFIRTLIGEEGLGCL